MTKSQAGYVKYLFGRVVFHLTNYFKPLTVHTEAIFIDEVWEQVKKRAHGGRVLKWYVMTPANYDYFRTMFNPKMTKSQISAVMKKRYLWLKNHGQKIELHVHLNKTMNITLSEQEKLIREAIEWMRRELGITPREFVPGWWAYNEDTLKLLKKYGLEMVKENDYKSTHDYNWI